MPRAPAKPKPKPPALALTTRVPLCHHADSKMQVFDVETCKRSAFQVLMIERVSQRADFSHFLFQHPETEEIVSHGNRNECTVKWITRTGSSHAMVLSLSHVFSHNATGRNCPIPPDSEIYRPLCIEAGHYVHLPSVKRIVGPFPDTSKAMSHYKLAGGREEPLILPHGSTVLRALRRNFDTVTPEEDRNLRAEAKK